MVEQGEARDGLGEYLDSEIRIPQRRPCRSAWKAQGSSGSPLKIELKLEVWDSPNSARFVVDAMQGLQ
jgi:hypothetical protein